MISPTGQQQYEELSRGQQQQEQQHLVRKDEPTSAGGGSAVTTTNLLEGAMSNLSPRPFMLAGKRHDVNAASSDGRFRGATSANQPGSTGTPGETAAKKRKIWGSSSSFTPEHNNIGGSSNPMRMGDESFLSRRMTPHLQLNDGQGYIDASNSADSARAMQMNLLQQQQHAFLASRLQQQKSQQEMLASHQQQSQHQQLSNTFPSATSFDTRFLQQGSNFFLGHGVQGMGMGMNPSLLGASSGLMFPSFRGGTSMGVGANPNEQSLMQQQQFAFGGASGMNSGPGGNSGDLANDSAMASLGMTAASGRQLLLMQQALASGGGGASASMLANHQGQFLGGMPGFAMNDNNGSFGGQGGYGHIMPPSMRDTNQGGQNNPHTNIERTASSMTPAGISHQALYARDASEEDNGGVERNVLYMACDDESLSAYQCLVRKQIQLFDADEDDVESNAQGRNKAIVLGQVGIRCRHCSKIPPRHRTRGATYYPAKLHGLYQAAQNMASAHLCKHCQLIPDALRQELIILRDRKSSAGGGKQYWADGVRVLGVVEINGVLRFADDEKSDGSNEEEKSESDFEDDKVDKNETEREKEER